MPPRQFLLTSFTTWLPHHVSNASDDLLCKLKHLDFSPHSLEYLRLLPVETEQASQQVITKIQELQPDIILCCGMSEKRQFLSLERQAALGKQVYQTKINLDQLLSDLPQIIISDDAGKFVCEGLYHSVLSYLETQKLTAKCVFAHVPLLHSGNIESIVNDFVEIIHRLGRV